MARSRSEELGMTDEEITVRSRRFILWPADLHIMQELTGKYVMEGMARIPVEVDMASEFRYRDPIMRRRNSGCDHQPVRRDRRFSGGTA